MPVLSAPLLHAETLLAYSEALLATQQHQGDMPVLLRRCGAARAGGTRLLLPAGSATPPPSSWQRCGDLFFSHPRHTSALPQTCCPPQQRLLRAGKGRVQELSSNVTISLHGLLICRHLSSLPSAIISRKDFKWKVSCWCLTIY